MSWPTGGRGGLRSGMAGELLCYLDKGVDQPAWRG